MDAGDVMVNPTWKLAVTLVQDCIQNMWTILSRVLFQPLLLFRFSAWKMLQGQTRS